jgi:hypothetical protein
MHPNKFIKDLKIVLLVPGFEQVGLERRRVAPSKALSSVIVF